MKTEKRMVIMPNTYEQVMKILDSYKQRYGNISIGELITKFDTDLLILN